MKKFSTNPQINIAVLRLLSNGWRLDKRKKHSVLIAPNNRRIAIPSTPSDYNAFYAFRQQVRKMCSDMIE